MLDIPKIKAVLDRARRLDMDFPLFGSHHHAHLFCPPLPEEELEAWEALMQLRLPEDYRTYLTCLGNGGAGPAYGIAPFRCPLDENLKKPTALSDDRAERFYALTRKWYEDFHSDIDQRYLDYCEKTPEYRRMNFSDWDEMQYQFLEKTVEAPSLTMGSFSLANQGCSEDISLLLNGTHRGFCHGASREYDYAYPFWYQKADHREAITWPQYRDCLTPFSDYFMAYVEKVEKICGDLSAGKRAQFQRERAQVRAFLEAAGEGDWSLALTWMTALDPAALSVKTRSFYLHYKPFFQQKFPDRPEAADFYQRLDKTRHLLGGTEFTVCRKENEPAGSIYPEPTFRDFAATFAEPD